MKQVLILVALICFAVLAADDVAAVPQPFAGPQSSVVGHRSPVIGGADAITIPQMLSYQGKLTDTFGLPVADTTYSVNFRLCTVPSGGSPFWNETQTVRTRSGLFSTLLGSVTPIGTMPDAGAVYLGMAVAGGAELTPRLRIASAAYAYLSERAANADLLQGKDTTALDVRYVNEGQTNSVSSAMITNGTIAAADLNQMGAGTGQVMKWTGSAWAPRNDSVGGGAGDNAWVRSGSDSVLYTINRLGIARGGASNVLYGTNRFTHVNLGVQCTTGTSGQNYAYATVGGGVGNQATGYYATVSGGQSNTASGLCATIGGGGGNVADTSYATVGGGSGNTASGYYATVGGGSSNTASGYIATVGGGQNNTASGGSATVGGGFNNDATGSSATVGGGGSNSADTTYATVGGGFNNDATGSSATVGGGNTNSADTTYATVGGGWSNDATGYAATVGGGYSNTASGTYAMVPGGSDNVARSSYSFAAGRHARANHRGSFVWSDSAVAASESVYTAGANQFRVRARGGTWFYSNAAKTTGVYLAANSNSWAGIASDDAGEDFRPVDSKALLDKVAVLRVRDYKMKDQNDGTRHIGPVAQDFHNAFGYGGNETSINLADADGVALAAIQALYEQNQALGRRVAELEAKLQDR